MADIKLTGPLNLSGNLTLTPTNGGKVLVNEVEALVAATPPMDLMQGIAPPVILPPPPAAPSDPAPNIWIVNSFNQTVKTGDRALVAGGLIMQGTVPTWPGMMLPSLVNTGPRAVSINRLPINVVGDQGIVFPSGGAATFNASGQA